MIPVCLVSILISCSTVDELTPVRVVTELDLGESRDITLSNGESVNLTLLEINDVRDSLRNAIRSVEVKVMLDGKEYTLGSGNYHLPVQAGSVQIDCPVVKNYYDNSNADRWGLTMDARFRLWPAESPFMKPGTFVYPIKQLWFAGMSQSGNESPFVDWVRIPPAKASTIIQATILAVRREWTRSFRPPTDW